MNAPYFKLYDIFYFYSILFSFSSFGKIFWSWILQAPVVQTLDSAIHQINHYPAESVIDFPNTYPLDSDLSVGRLKNRGQLDCIKVQENNRKLFSTVPILNKTRN